MMEVRSFQGTFFTGLILLFVAVSQCGGHGLVRSRRNAIQMCNLINKFAEMSCFNYNQYGCFCGYGQRDSNPVDEVDRCCKVHDDCYGDARNVNLCYFWSGLFVGYKVNCDDDTCTCPDQERCARKVCECDLKLAQCFGESTFDARYKNYDRSKCV